MPDPRIEELAGGECRSLLAGRHLGRLALVDARGPVILATRTGRRLRIPDELPFTWWG